MEEDATKEEQRLLRTMNNRINAALQNKPKANFTFGGLSSTSSTSPSSQTPPPAQTAPPVATKPAIVVSASSSPAVTASPSYTSPAMNFSAPQNFSTPSAKPYTANKIAVSGTGGEARGIVTSRSTENIRESENAAAPEVVKSSNTNHDEEMKSLFAGDHERRMKMEEERLTRTLGKRSFVAPKSSASPSYSSPSASFTPPRAISPTFAQQKTVQELAPTPAPVPVAAAPPSHEHTAVHAASSVAYAYEPPQDVHAHVAEPRAATPPPPSILEDILIAASPDAPENVLVPQVEVHASIVVQTTDDASVQSIVNTIDDVLALAHGIGEIEIPVTPRGAPEGNVHVEVHNDHHHQAEPEHVPVHSDHTSNHFGSLVGASHTNAQHESSHNHAHGNQNVNLLADLISNTQAEEKRLPGPVTQFKELVDSVSKVLKAEKPINGDQALSTLETIGKVVLGIVPTIADSRLSGDVKTAAVELIKESIALKYAWENWSDTDEVVAKIIVKLGTLYIHVIAAF